MNFGYGTYVFLVEEGKQKFEPEHEMYLRV